ncbi:MAG: flavodoxin family protein [Anaerolineae bacterium]
MSTATILGISASGRPEGITAEVVHAVLEATGEPYTYISLAEHQINGCRACIKCAVDSRCHQRDDWLEIGEQMLAAEAIVFGAPNYYGTINALGHACLERTFCFRHQERFRLAGKLGVAIGVDGPHNPSPVIEFIHRVMASNMMAVVGTVYATGYSQCYTCGFGPHCAAGTVVHRHGFLEEIEKDLLPPRLAEQKETRFQAQKVGQLLGSILRTQKA